MFKSLLKPLTVAELKSGATKLTNASARKKARVQEILSIAHQDGRRTEAGVIKQLEREFGTKRDWKRVALTERTEARGRASFDLVTSVFGDNAIVYRDVGENCCEKCCNLFGKPGSPKRWVASQVPEKIKGAVHPNCDCGAWRSKDDPTLTKSQHTLSDIPMGVVKRLWDAQEENYYAMVSTGNGYWVRMDSITGRNIVMQFALHVPVVKVRESLGFTVFVHGYFKFQRQKTAELYDLRSLSGARYYSQDLGDDDDQYMRNRGMRMIKTLDDYLSHIKNVMPVVATMPEYWDNDKQVRHLPDFFGFKTLTDWIVVVPGKPDKTAKIKRVTLSLNGLKRAIRTATYASMKKDDLKK